MRKPFEMVLRGLSSLWLSTSLLIMLGILTWLGTLEQVDYGLYEVQKKYFESFFLVHQAGPIAIPLPGANLVLCVLAVNLLLGGMIRLRHGKSTIGVFVTHIGIAILLVSSAVKLYMSDDGYVRLNESEQANWFQSYYDWELVIARETESGERVEFLVPQEDLQRAVGPRSVTFSSPELPLDVEVAYYHDHCRPMPKGPAFDVAVPVVEGAFLKSLPRQKEAGENSAGLYATVVEGDGSRTEGILWGFGSHPWTVEVDGVTWILDLRRERYELPFTIELADFRKEEHPRMSMAKAFESDVSVIEGESSRPLTISMNEPLRDRGYVMYQSSWGPQDARPGDSLYSVFSVVRNPADQYPLYACIVIATGLLLHFLRKLTFHVRAEARMA